MTLQALAYLSYFLLTPVRLSCRILSGFGSQKTRIFFRERTSECLIQSVQSAQAALKRATLNQAPVVYWIHVASAGELEQVIPILRHLHEKHGVHYFLTYFSPSAKSFIKNCPGVLSANSLPLENPSLYRTIIESLSVKRVLLVRYDFWPMMFNILQETDTPIGILAATLESAKSPFPKKVQAKIKSFWLRRADLLFMVQETEFKTLAEINFPKEKLVHAGDAKWQRAKERAQRALLQTTTDCEANLNDTMTFVKSKTGCRIMVFGSPHEDELNVLRRFLQTHKGNHIALVAPPEIDEKHVCRLSEHLESTGADVFRWSRESTQSMCAHLIENKSPKVVIIDTFGFLAEAYRCGDVAIVGGGFDGQLHNVLEPAAYPVLTLYGNRASRAPEAKILLERNAAVGFSNTNELFQFLTQWSSLELSREEDPATMQALERVLYNAKELFGSLPDTSEVVCQALARQDQLETI